MHISRAGSHKPAATGRGSHTEPAWVRWSLISLAVFIMSALVIVPVANVFYQALANGFGTYREQLLDDADTRHAIWLTLTLVPMAVAFNTLFGVAVAWAVTRFRFPGRTILTSVIDLPFAVSPVVAGLMILLMFAPRTGLLGPWLDAQGLPVVFNWPGIVLATTFVTLPFVARELIPVMEALGADEEIAAVSLGANGWQLFWRVTLPNIRLGLLYGIILCNSRAMGEYGAVSVVSGRISGQTDTMPLRVEKLFQESNNPGSFAVASVLTLLALVTLIAKTLLEHHNQRLLDASNDEEQVEA
jgi:sulfate transport system permease protein